MPSVNGHRPSTSISQNQRAVLATAYNELGKELSSTKVRVVGNYNLGRVIGEGSYGKVRLGTHRLTGTKVAIKHIPKAMSAALTREIHHHRQLHHPHVTQMYEVIATEQSIWIVTELCHGGELFDYLVEKGRVGESEAKALFGQLCLAVSYLHDKGVVHRDLKLENVLLDERCRVKLGDFGFTREWERGTWMETFCGTTGYAAPEMLQQTRYQGPEVDVWSLGVILYTLLVGALPFDDDDENEMKRMIIEGNFEDPEWLSDALPEARDLIKSILVRDPMKRATITQILTHKWFSTPSPPTPTPSIHEEAAVDPTESPLPETPEPPSTPVDQTGFKRRSTSSSILPPPPHAVRTPARTKRRSVSSAISSSDEEDDARPAVSPSPIPFPNQPQADFASLQQKKAALLFSTSQERELLNTLSLIGLDTGQIVHSVLTDACDASGAIWWMLSRKWEGKAATVDENPFVITSSALTTTKRKMINASAQTDWSKSTTGADTPFLSFVPATPTVSSNRPITPPPHALDSRSSPLLTPSSSSLSHPTSSSPPTPSSSTKGRKGRSGSVSIMQRATTALEAAGLVRKKSSEAMKDQVAHPHPLQPPTVPPKDIPHKHQPVLPHPPERKSSLGSDGETSPSPRSSGGNKLTKSPPLRPTPATPPPALSSSLDATVGSPWVFTQAGPSSATSLVSADGTTIGGGPGGSQSNLIAASLSTPSLELNAHSDATIRAPKSGSGSGRKSSGGGSGSAPSGSGNTGSTGKNRANLLATFRLWFGDGSSSGSGESKQDKKGKRKASNNSANPPPSSKANSSSNVFRSVSTSSAIPPPKRRTSGSRSRFTVRGNSTARQRGHSQRPSISSRRSSSVNSRRSSIASVQMVTMLNGNDSTVSAVGTPSRSSRPSSVHSMQGASGIGSSSQQKAGKGKKKSSEHRKSPSASSTGSQQQQQQQQPHRQSPLQSRYHHRAGSTGSHTRVVRASGPTPKQSKKHGRSDSAASSIASSRRNSWYEGGPAGAGAPSDTESISKLSLASSSIAGPSSSRANAASRASSPFKRKSGSGATFLAKRPSTAPFAAMSPSSSGGSSVGRNSWKKSWGLEPPGWSTRSINTQHTTVLPLPIEVLAISPGVGSAASPGIELGSASIRDVFAKPLGSAGGIMVDDDDEWVDEEEFVDGTFVGGLGQGGLMGLLKSAGATGGGSGTIGSLFSVGETLPTSSSSSSNLQDGTGTITLSPVPKHKRGKSGASSGSTGGPGAGGGGTGAGTPAAGSSKPLPTSEAAFRQMPNSARGRGQSINVVMEEDEEEEE
ncbi:Pkinase-domain-containing protein [Flagelloscypha sp. PMI_526]|nr:Pkinase-domain-containing protein [Flagelloscypha sp. PMI_526]